MDNHNNQNHDSKMMWLMMIFCALPLVVLLFTGSAKGGFGWFALIALAVFVIAHSWLMRKGHGGHDHKDQK